MNINAYVICDQNDTPNWWSISHTPAQAWEDFRNWYTTADEEITRAAPEIAELQSAGYKCVEILFNGVIV